MLTHDLVQIVKQPTRIQDSPCSIFDFAFINRDFTEHTVIVEGGLSDQFLVYMSISLVKFADDKTSTIRYFRDYDRANDASVIAHMENCLIDFAEDHHNVCFLWNKFADMCNYCFITFVLNKRKKGHKRTPWVTRKIIHLKRKLKWAKRSTPNPIIINGIKNDPTRGIHESKDFFFTTTLPNFMNNEPRKFWDYLSDADRHVTQVSVDGISIADPQVIAEYFNTYFILILSVFKGKYNRESASRGIFSMPG